LRIKISQNFVGEKDEIQNFGQIKVPDAPSR